MAFFITIAIAFFVIPGLVPGIQPRSILDTRDKPGYDKVLQLDDQTDTVSASSLDASVEIRHAITMTNHKGFTGKFIATRIICR